MHTAYGSRLLLPTPETKCLAPPLSCWDLAGFQILIFRRTLKFFQLALLFFTACSVRYLGCFVLRNALINQRSQAMANTAFFYMVLTDLSSCCKV